MAANSPEYQRSYMRAYRAGGRDKSRGSLNKRFVAVDGEGGNLDNGYHAYFLLTAGQSSLVPSGGNARLTSRECLGLLADLDPKAIYVAYFFDYDVTKICEDLPWAKLRRLMDRSSRVRDVGGSLFPVDWDEFQLDYLPRKEFKVRRKLPIDRRCPFCDTGRNYGDIGCDHIQPPQQYGPWIVINDVGSFFQCRFVEALEKWNVGTAEQRALIKAGKDARSTFSFSDIEDITEYNNLEIELLQELMERFRDACVATGYVPTRWQGPGLLAESMFRAHNVPPSKEIKLFDELPDLAKFAASAFYGGRPEISAIGPVNCPTYQYDINSAYPDGMRFVPCLEHGQWDFMETLPEEPLDFPRNIVGERYGIVFGTFTDLDDSNVAKSRRRPMFYGLPIRSESGTILYPASGAGWYWSFEVDSAIHQRFMVSEAWIYTRTCTCEPLAFVESVYKTRQEIGKDGPGIVLKLGLNSLYGKTVQSIGAPKYANPIWGSFITAWCRTKIQHFLHSSPSCGSVHTWCGSEVLMIATDSVCTTIRREDIDVTSDLGGWSLEVHPEGMFLIQPGLYFGSSGKNAKTRGVPQAAITSQRQQFRDAFDALASTGDLACGDVRVPQTLFCGIRYALHRRNLKLLGQWIEFSDSDGQKGKVIKFDWASKRAPYPALRPVPGVHDWIQTFPQKGSVNICTVPYSKNIGGLVERDDSRIAFEAQPDWSHAFSIGALEF